MFDRDAAHRGETKVLPGNGQSFLTRPAAHSSRTVPSVSAPSLKEGTCDLGQKLNPIPTRKWTKRSPLLKGRTQSGSSLGESDRAFAMISSNGPTSRPLLAGVGRRGAITRAGVHSVGYRPFAREKAPRVHCPPGAVHRGRRVGRARLPGPRPRRVPGACALSIPKTLVPGSDKRSSKLTPIR
jgi:hypothetical protein